MRKWFIVADSVLVAGTTVLSGCADKPAYQKPIYTPVPTDSKEVKNCIERLVAGGMLPSSARKACEEKYGD